jgi:uncharacterized delta-60 repeat protein
MQNISISRSVKTAFRQAFVLLFVIVLTMVGTVYAQRPVDSPSKSLFSKQALLEESRNQNRFNNKSQIANLANSDVDGTFNTSILNDTGSVEDILQLPDGKILVGGTFSNYDNAARSGIVRLNADGTVDASFSANVNGGVWSIVRNNDGKILIGGDFTEVNGAPRANLVRLNPEGTVDTTFSLNLSFSAVVFDIKIRPDGKILIGGDFTTVNGVSRNRIALLNSDGTLDTSFNPGTGANGGIYRIALQADGKIMLAGFFTQINGANRQQVARLNADGSFDDSFNFSSNEGGSAFDVVVQPDNKILVAGSFYTGIEIEIIIFARLNNDGSIDNSFAPIIDESFGLARYVEKIEVQENGKIALAGYFGQIRGVEFNNVARLNSDGSVDGTFNSGTGTNSTIEALEVQSDGKVLIGGPFNAYNSVPKNHFTRLNTNGTLDSSFNTGNGFTNIVPGVIYSTATQPDGKILAGGYFDRVNGVSRYGIVRLNADGTLDNTFNAGLGTLELPGNFNAVYNIALQSDGKILIGGFFFSFNGEPRRSLVRLNSNGSIDQTFNSTGSGVSGTVWKILVLPDGKILIGGQFTQYNSFNAPYLARLNSNGELDFTFNSGVQNGIVLEITRQSDGEIFVGGTFNLVNGQSRNRIARLNTNGSLDTSFNIEGADSTVWSIVPQPDGKYLVGGNFTSFNGTMQNRLVRLNANGSLDTSFNLGSGANGTVFDVFLQPNGKILIGGLFSQFNGAGRNNLVRLNADGTLDSGYLLGTNSIVRNITEHPENKILISGSFSSINGVPRTAVARLLDASVAPRTPFDFDGDAKADVSVFRPANGGWFVSQSSNSQILALSFGQSGDLLAPADFDGDGRTDISVYRNGFWYRLNSGNNQFVSVQFGAEGDLPVPADFDGDTKADITVFRPSDGTWYRLNSSNNQFIATPFGTAGDVPLIGDFDGDSKSDIAVFRPADGGWYLLNSSNNQFVGFQFGTAGDKAVPADYDGDGNTDPAVFRQSNGTWYRLNSSNGQFAAAQFGLNGDIAAPADYDGDGRADLAVFRTGNWFIQRTTQGFYAQPWGASNDSVIPATYIR